LLTNARLPTRSTKRNRHNKRELVLSPADYEEQLCGSSRDVRLTLES
jgi:hypothetical protein